MACCVRGSIMARRRCGSDSIPRICSASCGLAAAALQARGAQRGQRRWHGRGRGRRRGADEAVVRLVAPQLPATSGSLLWGASAAPTFGTWGSAPALPASGPAPRAWPASPTSAAASAAASPGPPSSPASPPACPGRPSAARQGAARGGAVSARRAGAGVASALEEELATSAVPRTAPPHHWARQAPWIAHLLHLCGVEAWHAAHAAQPWQPAQASSAAAASCATGRTAAAAGRPRVGQGRLVGRASWLLPCIACTSAAAACGLKERRKGVVRAGAGLRPLSRRLLKWLHGQGSRGCSQRHAPLPGQGTCHEN